MEHTKYYCSNCKLSVIVLPSQEPIKACNCNAVITAEIAGTVVRQISDLGNS